VVGLCGIRRALLPLTSVPAGDAKRFRDRVKDLQRRVKNNLGGSRLALRLNTDLARALAGIEAHHQPSWVSPELARVWRYMFDRGFLVVFELWLITADGAEEMIAADIAFPMGRCRAFFFKLNSSFSPQTLRFLWAGVVHFCLIKLLFFCFFLFLRAI
jgi:hypothetical protein